jgi:hypothetical protein
VQSSEAGEGSMGWGTGRDIPLLSLGFEEELVRMKTREVMGCIMESPTQPCNRI